MSNVVSQYNLMVYNVNGALIGNIEIVLACLKVCIKLFLASQVVYMCFCSCCEPKVKLALKFFLMKKKNISSLRTTGPAQAKLGWVGHPWWVVDSV